MRTAEQTLTGIYWGYDGRPGWARRRGCTTRSGHYRVQEGNTEANARMFALVTWPWPTPACRLGGQVRRGVLAAGQGIRGGSRDRQTRGTATRKRRRPEFRPLARRQQPVGPDFTPPFPAYTSGHASFGAPCSRCWGASTAPTTSPSRSSPTSSTASPAITTAIAAAAASHLRDPSQAEEENGQSRTISASTGVRQDRRHPQGRQIADEVFRRAARPS